VCWTLGRQHRKITCPRELAQAQGLSGTVSATKPQRTAKTRRAPARRAARSQIFGWPPGAATVCPMATLDQIEAGPHPAGESLPGKRRIRQLLAGRPIGTAAERGATDRAAICGGRQQAVCRCAKPPARIASIRGRRGGTSRIASTETAPSKARQGNRPVRNSRRKVVVPSEDDNPISRRSGRALVAFLTEHPFTGIKKLGPGRTTRVSSLSGHRPVIQASIRPLASGSWHARSQGVDRSAT